MLRSCLPLLMPVGHDDVIGLNRDQAGDRIHFLGRELIPIAVGSEQVLLLIGRKIAKLAEGLSDLALAIRRKIAKLLHGVADLLALLWRKLGDGLIAFQPATAAIRAHIVKLRESFAHTILRRRRKVVESGLVLERLLLLIRSEIAVTVHPLQQMLLVLSWVMNTGKSWLRRAMRRRRFAGSRSGLLGSDGRDQTGHQQGRERCRESIPDLEEQHHKTGITSWK